MELLIKNYKVVLGIAIFIIFALIGYLIETLKKDKKTNETSIEIENIEEIKIEEIKNKKNEEKENVKTEQTTVINESDDLLNDYNNLDTK